MRSTFPLLCVFVLSYTAVSEPHRPLLISIPAVEVSLDPADIQDQSSLWISRQINCQLVRSMGRKIEYEAAQEIIHQEPTVLDIVLKPNIRFSDGSVLKSEDVVATFQYLRDARKVLRNVFRWVVDVKAVDPLKVRFTLNKPSEQVLQNLSAPNYALFSAKFIKQARSSPALWKTPVGCGKYRVTSDDSTPATKRVLKLESVQSKSPQIHFLLSGGSYQRSDNADIIAGLGSQDTELLETFRKESVFDPYQILAGINVSHSRQKSLKSRCALLNSLTPESLVPAYRGRAEVASDLFPRGIVGFAPNSPFRTQASPTAAKTADANLEKVCVLGVSVPLDLQPSYENLFKHQDKRPSYFRIDDTKRYSQIIQKEQCELTIIGLKSNYLDGYEYLLTFLEDHANFTGLKDPELRSLISSSQDDSELVSRAYKYQRAVKKIHETCVVKPLITIPYKSIYVHKSLDTPGIGKSPLNDYDLTLVKRRSP